MSWQIMVMRRFEIMTIISSDDADLVASATCGGQHPGPSSSWLLLLPWLPGQYSITTSEELVPVAGVWWTKTNLQNALAAIVPCFSEVFCYKKNFVPQ
jgi:hypothetical protein